MAQPIREYVDSGWPKLLANSIDSRTGWNIYFTAKACNIYLDHNNTARSTSWAGPEISNFLSFLHYLFFWVKVKYRKVIL
jgi:hypothetical protein